MMRADAAEVLRQTIDGAGRAFFVRSPHPARPIRIFSAPGRLDALGGLGVDAGGTVAQMALPLRVAVAVQLSDEPLLRVCSAQIAPPLGESPVEIALPSNLGSRTVSRQEIAALTAGAKNWAAPAVSLWRVLQGLPGEVALSAGCRVMIHGEIPMGAGQASSTALLTALLLALLSLGGTGAAPLAQWDPLFLAQIVQDAEMLGGGGGAAGGGAIDAMTCLLAAEPLFESTTPRLSAPRRSLLRYSARPCELVGHVPLPENLRVLALDSGVRYISARAAVDELRIAGAMGLAIIETIYRDLGQTHTPLHGYLSNTSPLLYRQYFRALLPRRMRGSDFVRTFGSLPGDLELDSGGMYRIRTAVDHLIAENEHAEQFLQAMEELSQTAPDGRPMIDDPEERQRTLQRAGRLALASHHSYRLRIELSCREADWLVDRLMEAGPDRGIYGARITGAGGGGTLMTLVDDSPSAGDAILEVIEGYHHVTGLSLMVVEAGAPGSAGGLVSPPEPGFI